MYVNCILLAQAYSPIIIDISTFLGCKDRGGSTIIVDELINLTESHLIDPNLTFAFGLNPSPIIVILLGLHILL